MPLHQLAYMCAPVAGNVVRNLREAKAWLRELRYLTEGLPLTICAPWITLIEFGGDDDEDPASRARGILDDCCIASRCDGTIAVGDASGPTAGMREEIAACPGWHLDLLPITRRFAGRVHEVDPHTRRSIRDAIVATMSLCAG